ncbi:MAG: FtsW/RodA/SpoVE family cell cycle protein [Planctomycetes bacterium]|nr:FtsW/RodA/SpoVE family cell cycle protein [Planctomycetota bacterium]
MSDSAIGKGLSARNSAGFIGAIVLFLTLLGLLHVMSATTVAALRAGEGMSRFVLKQAITVAVASAGGLFCYLYGYRRLVALGKLLLPLSWLLLLAVLLLGERTYGARRWIDFGFFSLQASEVAKFAIVLAAARYVSLRADRIDSYLHGFLPALRWLAPTALLIAVEPDFGTSMFILVIGFLLLFLGGVRLTHIVATAVVTLPVFVAMMIMNFDHILKRFSNFNGGAHEQVENSAAVMAKGGLVGVGIGSGRAQFGFVPFVESDFIFASVGEQLGLAGTFGLLLLFALFFWHGLKIALRARDRAGFIVGFGLSFMIVFQAGINMAVVTGIVPPKGIGLPFVSYGGSSLMMLGAAVGTLASVARLGLDGPAARVDGVDAPDPTAESWDDDLEAAMEH